MCDYSLMEFPNRLAVDGEVLVVHRFRSGCLGLATPVDKAAGTQKRTFWHNLKALFAPEEPSCPAVCIPPGARLLLHDVPMVVQKSLGVKPGEEVTFVQLSATENQHRDAIRFRTGHILRLQELTVGQRVEVIDLGNAGEEIPEFSGKWEPAPSR
jgi:hypothetical protein